MLVGPVALLTGSAFGESETFVIVIGGVTRVGPCGLPIEEMKGGIH